MSKRSIGLFEAKTRFSEICEQVAETGEAVTVTRRGKPLVQIQPAEPAPTSVWERRGAYLAAHPEELHDDEAEFEVTRSRETSRFHLYD